jgi:hypothetical protein
VSLPRRQQQQQRRQQHKRIREHLQLPLVEISGPVAKTTTLVTMAAQFVVQTRPSRFDNTTGVEYNTKRLPQVFIFDADWQITPQHISERIRSLLLCDYNAIEVRARQKQVEEGDIIDSQNHDNLSIHEHPNIGDWERLQVDCEDCFQRVHVAQADENNSAGWLPLVASLEDLECYDHPTLVLWDGFLHYDHGSTGDVCRTLLRILSRPQAPTMLVYTTRYAWPRRRNSEWNDRVTHRIRLEASSESSSHNFVAFCDGQSEGTTTGIPFSITAAGIRG